MVHNVETVNSEVPSFGAQIEKLGCTRGHLYHPGCAFLIQRMMCRIDGPVRIKIPLVPLAKA